MNRRHIVIDAEKKRLGRLASEISRLLLGKHKTEYQPHSDAGDFVTVVNADKITLGGKKSGAKKYFHYSGYPGGMKTVAFSELFKKSPARVLHLAVSRMLPETRLRKKILKRLSVKTLSKS